MIRAKLISTFSSLKEAVFALFSTEMDDFISSSKLLKHWPSLLIGLIIAWVIRYFKSRQNQQRPHLEADEDVAVVFEDCTDSTALQPALAEKPHVPFKPGQDLNPDGARRFLDLVRGRRSIRSFATQKPPISVIEDCVRAAGTSPSGAHTEPWTFCVVEQKAIKQAIREIVEHEEEINYSTRMHAQWVTDLRPLKTKPIKEYLSDAPYLILVFKQIYGVTEDGRKKQHYYNEISTSIATGILLCALQAAGLCSLVTTPLNCGAALRRLLERPPNEKLLILLAVGYAAENCQVPDLERKSLDKIMVKY